jgi:tetratricopeptide (TPR) repeat protein
MSDAIPDNLALEREAQASSSPSAHPDSRVTSLEVGLAIAFGTVFLFGMAAWVLELFGEEPGAGFAKFLLVSQVVTVCCLLGFVLLWEQLPLTALGISKPSRLDLEFGLALFILLLGLEVAVGSFVPILYTSEIGFLTRSLWLPIPKLLPAMVQLPFLTASGLIITMVLGEELAVRGYAFTQLEQLTHRTVLAAGVALLLDLFAHAPLWGLDYTICMVPAELILMWLYVSERRLLPCLVGHLAFDLFPLLLIAAHFSLLAGTAPALKPHTLRGMELMESHEYARAIGEFDQALLEDSGDAMAYQWRGAAYAHQGNFDQAIKDLGEAIRLDPKQVKAFVNRSFSYRSKGDLPRALADVDSAIKLDPSDPDLLYRRGFIYSKLGEHAKAIDDFSAMIALAPNDPLGYQQRAAEHNQKREFKEALDDVNSAIRLGPADPENYSARAGLEFETHDYDKAATDYGKALALDRFNLKYAYAIAQIYKYLGRFDDEISFCKKLAADHPKEADADACVADGYYRKGDLTNAISAMSRAIEARPDAAMLYSQRATLEITAGLGAQAQADIEKVPTLQPNDPQANNYAAWLLSTAPQADVRDPRKAIAFATKACKLTSWNNAQLLDTLAAAYADNGDFSEAVKWQQYALKVAGSSRPKPVLKEMHERLALYQDHTAYRDTRWEAMHP